MFIRHHVIQKEKNMIEFNMNVKQLSLVFLTTLLFCGCEDNPRALGGAAIGGVGGAVAGVGIAKSLGASSQLAAAIGVMSAAAGAVVGGKVGDTLDKQAKAKAQEASLSNRPVVWVSENDEEYVALPSRSRNTEGRAMKVKVINKHTGKEIIIEN